MTAVARAVTTVHLHVCCTIQENASWCCRWETTILEDLLCSPLHTYIMLEVGNECSGTCSDNSPLACVLYNTRECKLVLPLGNYRS